MPPAVSPPPRNLGTPISAYLFPNHQRLKDHEPLARICSAFIQELFERGASTDSFFPHDTFLPLPFFITYALSRSPLDTSIAFGALSLLYRYKSRISLRHIKLRDPSRLFIAAYLVTAKSLSDVPFDMRTWTSLAQNNYDIHELAAMEREFCSALAWDLRINGEVLDSFRIITKVSLADTFSFDGGSRTSTPQPDVSTSPRIPELGHSFHSEATSPSPRLSSRSGTDDWVDIQADRSGMSPTQSELAEFEARLKSLFANVTPRKHAKSSMRKRCSEIFGSLRLGASLKRS